MNLKPVPLAATQPGGYYSNALGGAPALIKVRRGRRAGILRPLYARPCRCQHTVLHEDTCFFCGRLPRS